MAVISCPITWDNFPDSKVQGANMGPTWALSAPDGPHVGPINLASRVWSSRSHLFEYAERWHFSDFYYFIFLGDISSHGWMDNENYKVYYTCTALFEIFLAIFLFRIFIDKSLVD